MPRKRSRSVTTGPDWFLPEWMEMAGVTQAEIVRQTDWGKATVNDIYHGKTEYRRELINALASILKIQPFELLLHPDEAHHIRRLRAAVDEEGRLRLVAEQQQGFRPADPEPDDGRLRPSPRRRA